MVITFLETGALLPRKEGPHEFYDFEAHTWKPAVYDKSLGRSLPTFYFADPPSASIKRGLELVDIVLTKHPEAIGYMYEGNGSFAVLRKCSSV